ncbi:MAG TPA: M23 family metallopeptidase [Myxococcaceae bacterium]|nr:M23 family metallopeptidase [Myxococcaceae bacterium]
MREVVRLGPPPKAGPLRKTVTFALVCGLAAGGYYTWKRRATPQGFPTDSAPMAASPSPESLPASTVPVTELAPAAPGALPRPAAAPKPPPSPVRHARVQIQGALESSIAQAVGAKLAPALSQVTARSLVWWVTVPQDLKKGDTLDLLFEERENEEPLVHAVRFTSSKTGKTHLAYRHKAAGDTYARYYHPSGEEVEMRLTHSPLADYEQVTSLIRDGRRHKGVDFKTAVGTDVRAPFSGTLTRRNWNFRSNGNSLELTEQGGRRKALFLHLDAIPNDVKVGRRVTTGELMAKSGNSGHSFAPHLHYQLMSASDRVLDPFTEQQTYRKSLGAEQLPALEADVRKLDALWAPPVAAQAQQAQEAAR